GGPLSSIMGLLTNGNSLAPLRLLDEGRSFQVQQPRRRAFVAIRALERTLDQVALDARDIRVEIYPFARQRRRRRRGRLVRLLDVGRQVFNIDLAVTARERNGAFD